MAPAKNKQELDELAKKLTAKEGELKSREEALNKEKLDSEERGNVQQEREEYLDARENELKKRESAIDRAERDLVKKQEAFEAAVKAGIIDVAKKIASEESLAELDLVEVVCVRSDGTPGPAAPKHIGGKEYEASIDDNGFPHFKIPRSSAKRLISDESATRHFFVGPEDRIVCDVMRGVYSEKKVYNRCVGKKVVQNLEGGGEKVIVRWNPVILETTRK